jgi:DNA polymerase IV
MILRCLLAAALSSITSGVKSISLLAISVSHLEEHWDLELELPLGR